MIDPMRLHTPCMNSLARSTPPPPLRGLTVVVHEVAWAVDGTHITWAPCTACAPPLMCCTCIAHVLQAWVAELTRDGSPFAGVTSLTDMLNDTYFNLTSFVLQLHIIPGTFELRSCLAAS